MNTKDLKHYTSTKTVEAMPMTAGEFHELTKRNPKNNGGYVPEEPGYYIKYPDGYESWCPKDTFERDYKCSETPLDRMEIEIEELKTRIAKLKKFINEYDNEKPIYSNLDMILLLSNQLMVMEFYCDILARRIKIMRENTQN